MSFDFTRPVVPGDDSTAINRGLLDLQRVVQALRDVPFLDGELHEGFIVRTTGETLYHGLGRKWRGYLILRHSNTHPVYVTDSDNPQADRDTKLVIKSGTGTTTVDLWIF